MPEHKITLGCDPELFVRRKADGAFIPAYGLIPGDKKNPHPVPFGAIQVDGCAVEFNIDPTIYPNAWRTNIFEVRQALTEALGPEYEAVVLPDVEFSPSVWDRLPDEAKVLGCDPDFNAYTGKENPRPDGSSRVRVGAGHIHVGFTEGKDVTDPDHIADCCEVVQQLDYYLGMISNVWDKTVVRREFYGKAGAFRPKTYGVEYRVLSNLWLRSPRTVDLVFQLAKVAVLDLFDGIFMKDKYAPNRHGTETARFRIDTAAYNPHDISYMGDFSDRLRTLHLTERLSEIETDVFINPRPKKAKGPNGVELGPIRPNQADEWAGEALLNLQRAAVAVHPDWRGRRG